MLSQKNPLSQLGNHVFDLFDTLLEDGKSFISKETETNTFLQKDDNGYHILIKALGFSKDNIKISIEENVMSITGKRSIENDSDIKKRWIKEDFKKTITVPLNAQCELINAKMENGILEIMIPIKEESKAKTINII